jgi:hypothetical protein
LQGSRAGSRAGSARYKNELEEEARLGSARYKNELEEEARLGSFEAREPLRAEPSQSELEPAHEPRANFLALGYVLSAAVLNGIICHADCTLIIT